ncbi:MAG: hypothetical protein KIT68_09635 [Phycisphaeraceae bacterium]|nr:hypothetical protein [Phycisphaeraceae bacterium]
MFKSPSPCHAVSALVLAASLGLVALGAPLGEARPLAIGPPLICVPIDCGAGAPMAEPPSGQDAQATIAQALAALDRAASVMERMETLRRATMALSDRGRADLLLRLACRALDAQAAGTPDAAALAWFDGAYFVGCADQLGDETARRIGVADGVPGYLWMQQALRLSAPNAARHGQMQFAAAMLVHPAMHRGKEPVYLKHLDRAREAAKTDALLRANVDAHVRNWGGHVQGLPAPAPN